MESVSEGCLWKVSSVWRVEFRSVSHTLKFDVAVDETDCVHPPHGPTELSEYATQHRLSKVRVRLRSGHEIEQFTARHML